MKFRYFLKLRLLLLFFDIFCSLRDMPSAPAALHTSKLTLATYVRMAVHRRRILCVILHRPWYHKYFFEPASPLFWFSNKGVIATIDHDISPSISPSKTSLMPIQICSHYFYTYLLPICILSMGIKEIYSLKINH